MNSAPQDSAPARSGVRTSPADRYQAITAVEDLGLHYPPTDHTEDLVGIENAPGRNLGGSAEGNESDPHEGE